MPVQPSKLLLAALFLFIFCADARAQSELGNLVFRIDSLASVGLPKSALAEVDKLDRLARKTHNAAQQVNAAIYRITFQSYTQEDALGKVINDLKTDVQQADYPVKPVLQSLLAEIYWKYYQENRYTFGNRTRQEIPGDDFTKWDLQTISNEVARLYKLSISNAAQEQKTPISVLDGVLQGDPATRYLRPTLYDLLVQRAIDYFFEDEAEITRPKEPFVLNDAGLFAEKRAFSTLKLITSDTASNYFQGMALLKQATVFHLLKGDVEAQASLDFERWEFLKNNFNGDNKDSLYVQALRGMVADKPSKEATAQALSKLATFYTDSLKIGYYYACKAIRDYPKTKGAKEAFETRMQILQRNLSVDMENINTPGKPLLALLTYRNIKAARILIYHLTPEIKRNKLLRNYADGDLTASSALIKLLYKYQPVQNQLLLNLPATDDYRQHNAEFKVDALKPGYYILVVKNDADTLTALTDFHVSALAYSARLNPDDYNQISVVNRDSGKPLKGVHVVVFETVPSDDETDKRKTIATGFSGKNGEFIFKKQGDNRYQVSLSAAGDSLVDNQERSVTGEKEFDLKDLPEIRTIIYTDRNLYRPGQTIYFKAIQVKTTSGKSELMPHTDIKVNLIDANYRQISTQTLQTNDFGSIAGKFILPLQALGGVFHISSGTGNIGLRVEEYKRPSFNAVFLPQTQSWHFNDSVQVSGKVTAFSGYGLAQAKIAYHITKKNRPAYHPNYYRANKDSDGEDNEVVTDTVISNTSGEFSFKFKAIKAVKALNRPIVDYNITADITDASGETHSIATIVPVSNTNLQIEADIPENVFSSNNGLIPIKLSNLSGSLLNGKINVAIYALKQVGQTFKERKTDLPDQYLLSKDDFKAAFPAYAWKNEDNYDYWPIVKQLNTQEIAMNNSAPGTLQLDLNNKEPGLYRIVLKGQSSQGDTASITRYFNLVGATAKAQRINNWVLPERIKVEKGQKAVFWVGTGKDDHILMEKYDGAKLLSAEWLTLTGPDQHKLEVEVPVTKHNSFRVQFLMINDNRRYTDYEQITVQDTTPPINIRLLTYRDKMLPGEKERWQIKIDDANKERAEVEMLASMYDASLDDISGRDVWWTWLKPTDFVPLYAVWNNDDLTQQTVTGQVDLTADSSGPPPPEPPPGPGLFFMATPKSANFEFLDLSRFNYSGAGEENSYFNQRKEEYLRAAKSDKQLQQKYQINASLVKNGYDIIGRVISLNNYALGGAKIGIKNTSISTRSNSLGYFRIKVPLNGVLVITWGKYFSTKLFQTRRAGRYFFRLASKFRELEVKDPGPKDQKGDPTQEVRIDEPVGNSDTKADVEVMANSPSPQAVLNVSTSRYIPQAAVRFPPPVVKPDEEVKEKSVGDKSTANPIPLRRNFNETAFFYPQLHTNEKGEILLEFTMPDALTQWRFRAFAHTKDLRTDNLERTMVTQKQLSISANMPRFMREGDTITVSARLANLTADTLKGWVTLRLFNALNMQAVKLLANGADSVQRFKVAGSSNQAESFKLIIPSGLEALTYRLTAESGLYSDGEEKTLPVLPNRQLVIESMPFMVRAGQSKDFRFDKLVDQHSATLQNKTLTLEYTQNPGWYALQALPYMMEFPHECAEQLFSRYYANSLATSLMNHNPLIKQVFDQWKASNSAELLSNLEKNQELKATLLEETPWLRDAINETEQKKRLALLFDLNNMSNELAINLDKLKQKQLPNGGFVWFGGNTADRYITQHILAGIGQLYHFRTADTSKIELGTMVFNIFNYLNNAQVEEDLKARKIKNYATRDLTSQEIHTWYARSYFGPAGMTAQTKTLLNDYLKRAEVYWLNAGIYEQGMIALTMLRNGKPEVANAIIKSLTETAQHTDDMGMYWAKNQRGYYWYQSPVETQGLMIELFTEAGNHAPEVEEMKIWLLRNKQTSNWQSTTATAAACYALLIKNDSWLNPGSTSAIKLNGKLLQQLKPDVKADAGTGYIKTTFTDEQIKPALGKVSITNNGKSLSWGALHWQYLEQLDKISPSNTGLHLERKYFVVKQTGSGTVLSAVDASHQPKPGDRLKVVIYLKADHDMEYVQLKDMRPAGTEPEDALSEGKYQDGLYYYQVTKDVATNFFISWLTKGSYVFEYQLRVAQPGNFSTGITSIQSMYAPEFNAHSQGMRIGFGQ